jgi:uncharacterized membrane protein
MNLSKFVNRWGIWILMAGFTLAYIMVSFLRHDHFESLGFDLGIFDQEVWLLSQGKPPFVTILQPPMIVWGNHFTPALILLGPIFWFINDVKALLLTQIIIVVSGAWPLYQLAKKHLRNVSFSLCLAFSYLAFVGLQNALLFDFHAITLVAGGLAWAFWLLDQKYYLPFWVLTIILLHLKEDVSLIVISLAGYVFLLYQNLRLATGLFILSIFWFFLTTKFYIPSFFGGSFSHEAHLPSTLSGWWWIISSPPEKLRTLFFSFSPFGFLPLLSLPSLVMTGFHFFIHFLDPAFPSRWGLALHYRAPVTPMLAIGAIWGMKWLQRYTPLRYKSLFLTLTGGALMMGTLINQALLHLPLNGLAKPALYHQPAWLADTRFILSKVPPKVPLATQNNLIPHLSHREDVRQLVVEKRRFANSDLRAAEPGVSPCGKAICDWLEAFDKRWMVIDVHPNQPLVNFWSADASRAKTAIDNILNHDKNWWLVAEQGDALLLRYQGGDEK